MPAAAPSPPATVVWDALALILRGLDIGAGDEVITTPLSAAYSALAVMMAGARPVFADIRRDTLNLDERLLAPLITERTRAIVPVHYGGVGCEMRSILELAAAHGVAVVEDNAHGLFAKHEGRFLGTFGCLATQSFHETKNVTCGEGGALVVNDPALVDRAEIVREKGTNRSRYFRGEVDKYAWVDLGSSFLPSDILAGFLLAQLEAAEEIQAQRCRIWQRYHESLAEWAGRHDVRTPFIPASSEQACHMYYLILPSLDARQRLIAFLKSQGILAAFHYVPLHLSDMGMRFGGRPGQCPVTESVSERLVRLPFYNSLGESEQFEVVETIQRFDDWPQ